MKSYPVTVAVLSRFKTRAEQKEILARVRSGKVDVLIGTHRILQKDVSFKDLGLLIIDE
jgi:transcription-repair coupling factor (superfamily II helicase)